MTEQEWRGFAKTPGSVSTIEDHDWLKAGCPKCGCKRWQVTGDYWAYCDGCGKGFSTAYRFTTKLLEEISFE